MWDRTGFGYVGFDTPDEHAGYPLNRTLESTPQSHKAPGYTQAPSDTVVAPSFPPL